LSTGPRSPRLAKMSETIGFIYTRVAFECTLWLRFLGFYVLPWARLCDWVALLLALRWQRLRPWNWWLAVLMLALIGGVHLLALRCLVQLVTPLRGLLTPCVCHALEPLTGHQSAYSACIVFRTGSLLGTCLGLIQASFVLCLSVLSVIAEVCDILVTNPIHVTAAVTACLLLRRLLV
jgi:hypothetical protein